LMYGVVDVGTTGIKLCVYDEGLRRVYYEKVGLGLKRVGGRFLEQDSETIYRVVRGFARKAKGLGARLLGLAVYRASVVAWRRDGKPLTNVVTWVDRRGVRVVRRLPLYVRILRRLPVLGAVIRPESPAMLLKWFFDHVEGLRDMVRRGEAMAWTLDSYLAYRLSGRYVSDATNTAMTGLIHPKGLKPLRVVVSLLGIPFRPPKAVDNVYEYGEVEGLDFRVVIGDQQASAVAEGCLSKGRVKATHGTGTFMTAASGGFRMAGGGLVPVVIVKLGGRVVYGVEGFIYTTGSVVDWLLKIGLFKSYLEMEEAAARGRPGVFFLPSFSGLKTPPALDLRGVISGLTLNTTREDLIRGLAETVALYTAYILEEMGNAIGELREPLRCDGGYSQSDVFLQLLADYTGLRVERPVDIEGTARGVAALLAVGDGRLSLDEVENTVEVGRMFEPSIPESKRIEALEGFKEKLKRIVDLTS